MQSTRVTGRVAAGRAAVYRALIDARAVARWRCPDDMRCTVHRFEARVGGEFRVSLTYDAGDRVGKTVANTDTYRGRFLEVVPGERVVEQIEFEADDAAFGGSMTMTTVLTDSDDGGTWVTVTHDGLPDAISATDNETGTRMALANLADLVPTWTVYEAAGGAQGMHRLAGAWHTRVMADNVVGHAFSHGFHPEHTERLAAYWGEALGGPATYSREFGDETSVVRMHSGNGEHEEMNERAIACFDEALTDVGITDDPLCGVLHDYFAWATTTTMYRHHRFADDVPDGLQIPHWSWDGLQD